jgi:hypothetical protein
LARQLAGRVARQHIDQTQRARQKGGIDALAERLHQRLARMPRRDHECHQALDCLAFRFGGDKYPVEHAFDRVQVIVEMRERGALARDVHQVRGTAVQQEFRAAAQLDDVGKQ